MGALNRIHFWAILSLGSKEAEELENLVTKAVQEEREACAVVADNYNNNYDYSDEQGFGTDAAREIADKIRARGRS